MKLTATMLCLLLAAGAVAGETPTAQDIGAAPAAHGAPPAHGDARQAWSSSIQAPPSGGDAELQEAIRRLNSVSLPLAARAYRNHGAPVAEARPEAAAQPAAEAATQPSDEEAALARLSESAEGASGDPAALAETLFLGGRYDLAAKFYDKALQAETVPAEKAWLMFQLGNCQMRTDLTGAAKTYSQLAAEHADAPWASIAKARAQWIEWREKNDVAALLAQAEAKRQTP